MSSLLHHPFATACLTFALVSTPLHAVDIDWGTTPFAANIESDGTTPVGDDFVFYLGWFDNDDAWPGPSSSNTAEWMDHWHPVAISAFSGPPQNRFGGTHTVGAGDPPAGTTGYLLGIKRNCTNGEWVLLTNDASETGDSNPGDDWLWPASGGPGGFNETWTINTASVAILGQRIVVTPVPLSTKFQSAAVSGTDPIPMPPELWRQITFTPTQLANPSISAWSADPNENGRSNLLEFALDTSPLLSHSDNEPVATVIEVEGQKYLGLIVNKSHDAQVILQGAVNDTLNSSTWNAGPPHVLVHSQSCSQIIYRDATPITTATVRCLRLEVTLP
ncbi:MAG: hypothetical protein AAF591_22490 [Verrucomicrobiota bacterium]